MPRAPSICGVPGCPNRATQSGRCEQHQREVWREQNANRPTPAEQGYGAAWQKIRARQLHDYPWCARCLERGIWAEATQVDHIIPKRLGGTDEPENLESLCRSDHSAKTMRELNQARRINQPGGG